MRLQIDTTVSSRRGIRMMGSGFYFLDFSVSSLVMREKVLMAEVTSVHGT